MKTHFHFFKFQEISFVFLYIFFDYMDDDEEIRDERYSYVDTKPSYSSTVLTGNWFQTRCQDMRQSNTAVVPCVLEECVEQKGCEKHLTASQEAYSLEDIPRLDVLRSFAEAKADGYSNYMGQRSNYKFMDSEKFNRNFTTYNYLLYELWPRELRKTRCELLETMSEQEAAKKLAQMPPPDALDAYGNIGSTKFNPHRFDEPFCPTPTTYKAQFRGRYGPPTESAKRKDMIDTLG